MLEEGHITLNPKPDRFPSGSSRGGLRGAAQRARSISGLEKELALRLFGFSVRVLRVRVWGLGFRVNSFRVLGLGA